MTFTFLLLFTCDLVFLEAAVMVDDLTAILRLRPVDLDLERGLLGGLGFLPVASVDLSDSDALLLAASALSQGSSKISI